MATTVNYICECTTKTDNLKVHVSASLSSKVISSIKQGASGVQVTKTDGNFYYVPDKKGWASNDYLKITKINPISKTTDKTADVKKSQYDAKKDKQVTAGETLNKNTNDMDVSTYYSTQKSTLDKLLTKNLAGIHGMPYQFTEIVDMRIIGDRKGFGVKYAEKIVEGMPLLLLTPGRPQFMPGYSKTEKKNTVGALLQGAGLTTGDYKSAIKNILESDGRYYSFAFAYAEYYKFVNPQLQACAKYLNIQDVKVDIGGYTQKLGIFNWSKAVNNNFKGYISQKEFIAFYIDAQTQISESISNSTTSSQLGSQINSLSDVANEVQFLLGGYAGKTVKIMDKGKYNATLNEIEKIADSKLGGSKLFKSLGESFSTVAAGGKMYFPEIWQDSDYSKSYDISLKLRTPDGDKISWFLNICVPLIHLLCLAAPQQMGPNGYSSPFMIRGFYQGIFNCDMGMITSMDISKGKEGAWTIDGLPTEVDVSIQLKDLYSVLSISNNSSIPKMMKNIALMDYLANTCGVNVSKPELKRSIDMYTMLTQANLTNGISEWASITEQNIANKARTMYESFVVNKIK